MMLFIFLIFFIFFCLDVNGAPKPIRIQFESDALPIQQWGERASKCFHGKTNGEESTTELSKPYRIRTESLESLVDTMWSGLRYTIKETVLFFFFIFRELLRDLEQEEFLWSTWFTAPREWYDGDTRFLALTMHIILCRYYTCQVELFGIFCGLLWVLEVVWMQ